MVPQTLTEGIERANATFFDLSSKLAPPPQTPVQAPSPSQTIVPAYKAIVLKNGASVLPVPTADWDSYFEDAANNPLGFHLTTSSGEVMCLTQLDSQYRMAFDTDQPASLSAIVTVNGTAAGFGVFASYSQVKLNTAIIHAGTTAAGVYARYDVTLQLQKGRNYITVGFMYGNAFCTFCADLLKFGKFVQE